MPRLDLDDGDTLNKLEEQGVDVDLLPGTSLDVCLWCYQVGEFTDDVAHPPYSDYRDGVPRCGICGRELTAEDE